jgi:hypothetical protein
MPDKIYHLGLESWRVPECPFVVEYDPDVLEEIRRLAMNAFHSLPRGGAEIGGVLFGTHAQDRLRIQAFRTVPCQYAFGPSFLLSEKDLEGMAALVDDSHREPSLEGLAPVGWYHSKTRSDIHLSDQDLGIHDRFFPHPWQVALVVRPHTLGPSRVAFFFREGDGRMRGGKAHQEMTLRPAGRKAPLPRAEPEALAQAHANPPEPPPAPVAPEPAPLPVPPATPAPRRSQALPWTVAVLASAIAIALAIANTKHRAERPSPGPPALPTSVHLSASETDGQFYIRWDREALPVRTAKSGVLEIQDGTSRSTAPLNPENLINGTFTYARQNDRVDVRLTLERPDGSRVQESTGFSGTPLEHRSTSREKQLMKQVERLQIQLDKERKRTAALARQVRNQRKVLTKQ